MSARKIGLLLLLLGTGAAVETAWQVRGDVRIGPEGCRVIGGRFYGPSYAFEQAAERPVAAGETPRLEVENAFGGVTIAAGTPGVVKVRLRKVVFLPTEEKARAFAGRIELRLSGEGGRVRVGTNRDEIGRGEDVGFETHLEIEAPPETAAVVRNEHGRVDLAGLASAEITSSFDGVSVERIAGDVVIESRHGDVRVAGVGGRLQLNSRHGSVEVTDVTGAAKLDVEHGDLAARRTGALDVAIQHGGLEAEGVAGDLVVRGGHAGVRGTDVTGRAEVETSYAGVHLARIGGEVRASAQHGDVTAEDVAGGLVAETTHAGVELDRVDGPVQVTVDHGGVDASGLASGARVRTTGGEVSLDGFAGPVEVDVERGSARLAPRAVVAGEIRASVTHGEVRFELPEGSRVDLDVQSRRGEVRAEVPGLGTSERHGDPGRGERLSAKLGGGGVAVHLSADGDVSLEVRSPRPFADRPRAKPAALKQPVEAIPSKPATMPGAATPKRVPPAEATPKPRSGETPREQ